MSPSLVIKVSVFKKYECFILFALCIFLQSIYQPTYVLKMQFITSVNLLHVSAPRCRNMQQVNACYKLYFKYICCKPNPVAVRSKEKVCGRALAGIVGWNLTEDMDFVSCECLCCQAEFSSTGRSLVQRSPTDCGVFLGVIK
jgi:hypothetical protein